MNLLRSKLLIACIIFFSINLASGQVHDFDSLLKNDKEFKKSFKQWDDARDIFDSEATMNVVIESDFKNLVKRKFKDEYQPAILTYHINDTLRLVRDIEIKPRGNMRKSACFYPPLKLNFKKSEVAVKEMKEFDKMKMVLDCKRGKSYEQYLISEYYVYKVLNMLTDYSFRVRLMDVTYVDTGEKYKTATRHAFIIENKEQLAERHDAIVIDTKNIRDTYTNIPTVAMMYLFQYMIGNTDWSIPGRHNIQMIKSKDPSNMQPYVIPYDFDYAGIINTVYAVPDENLGTESVRERVYRGVCISEEELKSAAQVILSKKDDIYDLYQSSALMEKQNLRQTISYLDDFFRILENENNFRRYILETCRQ